MIRRLRRARAHRADQLDSAPAPTPVRAPAPAATATAAHPTINSPDGVPVPYVLRFMAAWSWRVLLVVAALAVFLYVFGLLSVVLVPVIIGLLLSAVASPLVDKLGRVGLPRPLATAVVILTGITALVALVALVAQQFSSGFSDLRSSFDSSTVKLERYLSDVGLSKTALTDFFDRVREGVGSGGSSDLGGTVLQATTTAGHLLAGLFIALFATIFFTYDGRGIWRWLVGLFPETARPRVQGSGERAWEVLTAYVRATVIIAAVDATGIVVVAAILGLPFLVPIGVLVFLGAFIPIVGASISGIAAVAVALVSEGPISALIMLGGVVAVQQLEGHVLQPFLLGRLVRVHPLAVVIVIAVGGLVAGIFGALIAVPLAAIVNAVASYLAAGRRATLDPVTGAPAATPAVAP